jgi:hypothetical protein
MSPRFCPTCGHAEVATVNPSMTGEFAAQADADEPPVAPTPLPYAGSDRCSWCGKHEAEVKKLITGPGVQICNECVKFCALILRDEDV